MRYVARVYLRVFHCGVESRSRGGDPSVRHVGVPCCHGGLYLRCWYHSRRLVTSPEAQASVSRGSSGRRPSRGPVVWANTAQPGLGLRGKVVDDDLDDTFMLSVRQRGRHWRQSKPRKVQRDVMTIKWHLCNPRAAQCALHCPWVLVCCAV